MRKMLQPISTVIIAVGLVAGAIALIAASPARPAEQTLHFDVQFHDTWLGRPALGVEQIQHDLLFSHGKQVGHTGGVCVLTDLAAPEVACAATFSLADGTITTQFLNTPPPKKIFAVTGGTGMYQNARGQGELVEAGNGKTSGGGTGTLTFFLNG